MSYSIKLKGRNGPECVVKLITIFLQFSYGDTLPHTVVGVCGEFQRTGRFLQRGI